MSDGNEAILKLQQEAMALAKKDKAAEWEGIVGFTPKELGVINMAKLYYAMNYAPSIPHGIILAMHCDKFDYKVRPEEGHVYITPAGKVGTSLEGLKIKCEHQGMKMGIPTFVDAEREKEFILEVKGQNRQTLKKDTGITCYLEVNGTTANYTAWLSEWFMGSNPNWVNRTEHMLRVRAESNCIKFATGVGVSESLEEPTTVTVEREEPRLKPVASAPSRIPTGFAK